MNRSQISWFLRHGHIHSLRSQSNSLVWRNKRIYDFGLSPAQERIPMTVFEYPLALSNITCECGFSTLLAWEQWLFLASKHAFEDHYDVLWNPVDSNIHPLKLKHTLGIASFIESIIIINWVYKYAYHIVFNRHDQRQVFILIQK